MFRIFPLFYIVMLSAMTNAQTINPDLDSLLTSTLHERRTALQITGMSAAIQFSDDQIWTKGSGLSTKNPDLPVTPDLVFGIASITKTLTAGIILQLIDEGKLSLDENVKKWFPELTTFNAGITIKHLLRHESGLYDVITAPTIQQDMNMFRDSIFEMRTVLKKYLKAPLFQPGTKWSYSNSNYIALGIIIQEITGKPYHLAFKERIYDALMLNSFVTSPYDAFKNEVCHPWLDFGNGTVQDGYEFLVEWSSFDSAAGPAGSCYATSSDLARWIKHFIGGSFISDTLQIRLKETVNTTFSSPTKYGLGVMERNFLGYTAYGHGGDFGYSSTAWYFPELDLSIAVLNNDGRRTSWQVGGVVTSLLSIVIDNMNLVNTHTIPIFAPKIFPVPFQEYLTVSSELFTSQENIVCTIYDMHGRMIQQFSHLLPSDQYLILDNLDHLHQGIYYLAFDRNHIRLGTVKVCK